MAVTKYLNPNYSEGGSEPKYLSVPSLVAGGEEPDLSNYLAKDNTTEFTPTADYHPATKKYVDDKDKLLKDMIHPLVNTQYITHTIILFANASDIIGNGTIYGPYNEFYSEYLVLDAAQNEDFTIATLSNEENMFGVHFVSKGTTISKPYYTFTGHTDNGENVLLVIVVDNRRILSETEYSALGITPETDNVLYFVTPD